MASQQAELDRLAKAQGFRDFATFQAYQAHQRMMMQGPVPGQAPVAAQPQPAAPPTNWLQNLINNYTPLGGAMARIRKALP